MAIRETTMDTRVHFYLEDNMHDKQVLEKFVSLADAAGIVRFILTVPTMRKRGSAGHGLLRKFKL